MTAPLIPLNSETDSLNEIENVAKTTFQHCHEMIKDIIEYSTDTPLHLLELKMQMNTLAESQKEIAGLIHATNEIYNLTDKVNLSGEQAIAKFQEVVNEYMEENDIDDNQKEILFSLNSFIHDEEISENQKEDSDVLVTKATRSYKDPLTQRTMEDPVKSKVCNHSYERETIMKYLVDSKKKCPYSGCQNMLSRRDLVDDFVLKMKLSVKTED